MSQCTQRIHDSTTTTTTTGSCEVRIQHIASGSFATCERTVSLRFRPWEPHTRFQIEGGRLTACWHPMEQRWLRLGFAPPPKWTMATVDAAADAAAANHSTSMITVVRKDRLIGPRTSSASVCASSASSRVWLAHPSGVFIGINRRAGTPPALRGHTSPGAGRRSAGCHEQGTLFQLHPVAANSTRAALPVQVRRPRAALAGAASACSSRMAAACGSTLRILAGVVTHSLALPTRGLPILQVGLPITVPSPSHHRPIPSSPILPTSPSSPSYPSYRRGGVRWRRTYSPSTPG